MLPNRLDYVPLWLGLSKAGVIAALVNCNLQGSALRHCISVAGARHVIVDGDTAAAVEAAVLTASTADLVRRAAGVSRPAAAARR